MGEERERLRRDVERETVKGERREGGEKRDEKRRDRVR